MNNKTIVLMALLITGNMVGAGILAMPIVAGIAGFYPSLLAIIFLSITMLFTGLVLVREINDAKQDSFNLPSLYEKHFGVSGKWLTSLANMIIFYGVLTSYLAGSTKLILTLFNLENSFEPFVLLLVFILLSTLAVSSIKIIQRYNTFFMLLLAITFVFLIGLASPQIEANRLSNIDWQYLPIALPMIIAGFVYHYVLPSLCKASGWSNEIYKPILIGITIAVLMNIIWLIAGIGVVPKFGHFSLNEARLTGIPITVEMSKILGSELFLITGSIFAIVAITTSYISIGMSLKDFLEDIFKNTFHISNKYFIFIVAFFPPLTISYLYVDIFLKALSFVSGVGVVILFGILPSIMAYKRETSRVAKAVSSIFFIVFCATLVITLLQTFGIININPK
jgi:tyrosine-specific transport protein